MERDKSRNKSTLLPSMREYQICLSKGGKKMSLKVKNAKGVVCFARFTETMLLW